MQWQREQVLTLAPDQASLKAAQGLSAPTKWSALGHNATTVWGECQGSGKTPYQTAIDLAEPAFKCSCPSRKFPCKHALALFLLYADAVVDGSDAAPPVWVQSWLQGRAKRQTAKEQPHIPFTAPSETTSPPNTAAMSIDSKTADRRATARAAKVAAGVDEVTLWLYDLVRGGFIEAQTRPYSYWQGMAARLIDAQASGLATQVQQLGSIVAAGAGWEERLTAAVGRLFLLLEAYARIEQLPAPLQQDVRTLIGWHQSKEEVLAGPAVTGEWRVLSHTLEQEETLISQRVWLQEVTRGDFALILNFAHPSNRQTLDTRWRVGAEVKATLYYYTSAIPLRALADGVTHHAAMRPVTAVDQVTDALHRYQQALAHQPWLTRYPLWLANVVVGVTTTDPAMTAFVYDEEHHLLPLSRRAKTVWQLLSITGGQPTQLFGEWLDDGLLPLGLWHEGRYWAL
jgi:hypothetical protein